MKNEGLLNNIITCLAIILAALSLTIAMMAKKEVSGMRSWMEEELKEQITQSAAASESNAEAVRLELEEKLRSLDEHVCRDVNVRSIAHRGVSELAPENTLPAFLLAKELGFSCVETDIRFTADGVPVCLHDDSIDRTSNGTGAIGKMALDEVKQLDFGVWMDSRFEGTSIPTFEEVLLLCKNIGLHPYIELKEGTSDQIRRLVDLVNRYGMKGKVSWISFDSSLLSAVRWYDDEARLGLLISEFSPAAVNEIAWLRSAKNEVFLDSSVYNSWVIEECRKAGLPLEIWTINKESQLADMDPYITGVTSNGLRYGQYLFNKETAVPPAGR